MDVARVAGAGAGTSAGAHTGAHAGAHVSVAAVVAEGRFVFVSGQSPTRDGTLVGGTIIEQTQAVLENLAAILRSAGARLDDVVKCGVFLADLDALPEFDEVYAGAFGAHLPARTTVGVALPGYAVQIDCIAMVPGAPPEPPTTFHPPLPD